MATLQFTQEQARQLEALYSTDDVRAQRAEMLRVLAPSPGESVIDVGCGPGFLCENIAQQVGFEGRVLGIDVSSDLIELARQRPINRLMPPCARKCSNIFPMPVELSAKYIAC